MYIWRMKKPKPIKYPESASSAFELKEVAVAYEVQSAPMIRTQIYLDKSEYDFVQAEAKRRNEPMAAVIRNFIDEKMELPEDAWTNNPMLEPTPHDPACVGHEDSGINHDHYLYGLPKQTIKVKGKWVDAPPLPDDYHENRASRDAYDRKVRKLDESR
jgi:hypothetical protein